MCVKICGGGSGRELLEPPAEDGPAMLPVPVDGTRRLGRGRIGRDVLMRVGARCDEFGMER